MKAEDLRIKSEDQLKADLVSLQKLSLIHI